jgi:hypothetical protein
MIETTMDSFAMQPPLQLQSSPRNYPQAHTPPASFPPLTNTRVTWMTTFAGVGDGIQPVDAEITCEHLIPK